MVMKQTQTCLRDNRITFKVERAGTVKRELYFAGSKIGSKKTTKRFHRLFFHLVGNEPVDTENMINS